MELIRKLDNPEIVVKFQQFCGVHRVPVCEGGELSDAETSEGAFAETDTYEHEKYVKHRHKYVLQDTCSNNNKTSKLTSSELNGYIKPGIFPPFSSDDSDSDNGISKSEEQHRLIPHAVRNRVLYYMFKFASLGGDETFYLTAFPFFLWNIDSFVIRHAVMVWSLTMYLGQATKDVLRWPRPPSPPVVRLETDFAEEYSWPSTHAVAGITVPFMIGYTVLYRYQIPPSLVITVCLVYSVMVCLSRLYLGVHTVLDIIGGILYSFGVILLFLPFIDNLDWFLQSSPVAPVILFLICFLLTICYPNPVSGNNTKSDAVQIISSTVGCLLGTWANYFNGMSYVVDHSDLMAIAFPSLSDITTAILRFIVGGATLIIIKLVVKAVTVKAISHVIGLNKPDSHNQTVKIWYKFITYMSLGVAITWTVPIFHGRMGLARPSYYAEVL